MNPENHKPGYLNRNEHELNYGRRREKDSEIEETKLKLIKINKGILINFLSQFNLESTTLNINRLSRILKQTQYQGFEEFVFANTQNTEKKMLKIYHHKNMR